MAYLVDNNVAEVLSENGRDLVVHVPIVGAEAMLETIQGFDDIARNLGGRARMIVWLNEALKGPIQPGGKEFEAILSTAATGTASPPCSACLITCRSSSRRIWTSF